MKQQSNTAIIKGTSMTQQSSQEFEKIKKECETLERRLKKSENNNDILVEQKKLLEESLNSELRNLRDIAGMILPAPGTEPKLEGYDIYGRIESLTRGIGGDFISYVSPHNYNFLDRITESEKKLKIIKQIYCSGCTRDSLAQKESEKLENLKKQKNIAGIFIADVAGHQATDIVLAGMADAAFHMAVDYELENNGTITTTLFERLNDQVYRQRQCQQNSTIEISAKKSSSKFITGLYGEIAKDGKFRFINAGSTHPQIFSNENNSFVEIPKTRLITGPAFGIAPGESHYKISSTTKRKKPYSVNELQIMGKGDIIILTTDGFEEHLLTKGGYKRHMEQVIRETKEYSAKEIGDSIFHNALHKHDYAQQDDMTLVVIKRNY